MADFIELRVDSRFIEGVEEYAHLIKEVAITSAARIREGLSSIILGTVETAMSRAGDGFPAIYREHLLSGIYQYLSPQVYATGDGVIAQVGDIADLGDEHDLYEGFHYHAIAAREEGEKFDVSNPVRIGLPYQGEELYNEFQKRYDFWQDLVDGKPHTVTFGGGDIPGRNNKLPPQHEKTFSTAGLYEETLLARVSYWGNRYPEWILLDQGVSWYPSIPATHVRYYIEQNCYRFMEKIYGQVFDEILDAWDRTRLNRNYTGNEYDYNNLPPDVSYDPRGRGSKLRGPGGRFV